MRKNIYFCKSCDNTGQNLKDLTYGNFSENQLDFYKGYIDEQEINDGNVSICPFCGDKMVMAEISGHDYTMLAKVSNFNRQLLDAMVDLHKKDIIEYELKMSQFRNQYEQGQQQQKQESCSNSNLPKCPYCNSTDLKKISGFSKAGSVALFGIFSVGKVSKQWHCNSCKSDF
ncbi:hypothetical protein FYJ38_12770 [Clostridium sp. WB02_MRS01]|uniref:hypothetical protein n=1 Tax=Clostridium sp. WB02_MRS01 TaxID=2605777 RepID=UPI0012B1D81E|nr:hypothetical protein [Clostridium sp. WB02_MRS01]MSS09512.1 hypothetical protein [Clostridium sp. WB02_MRS01]